ncbi:polysaccharide deacetylase family protein [Paenibacillus psychroresistens]|uniref:Polysaccharide deacetylase family protein n=2 Tax=Paenibacillus psychroresistens TaxID=1778678 RepID=A0A6B8RXH7_9BACL|nr:polysaccharide deacetylase family protein [Paenibacillus psychroresistens]
MIVIIGISLLLFSLNLFKTNIVYKDQIAVLMYHHIYDQDISSSTITTKLFRDQLTLLKNKGYQFISLQQMKEFLDGAPIPKKAVLVTFDDGYESFYNNAYPILKEMSIPAVNFIITGSLEHPQQDIPKKMSREQIKAMLSDSSLIEVQCHTDSLHFKNPLGKAMLVGHLSADGKPETDEQYKHRIVSDTQSCISKLNPLNPAPVDTLAYPYGIYNHEAVDDIQEAGIKYAFTILTKMTTRQADHLRIPRINAGSPDITPAILEKSILRSIIPIK